MRSSKFILDGNVVWFDNIENVNAMLSDSLDECEDDFYYASEGVLYHATLSGESYDIEAVANAIN